jgi:hypothetical protein
VPVWVDSLKSGLACGKGKSPLRLYPLLLANRILSAAI